jgi:CDGSH-type Zn-finger protein/uncharacterized Fe-S cluster protein YjdI
MTDDAAPDIRITSREDALYLLAEAAAIEHNLMCCYLYAAFSLKRSVEDGLTPEQVEAVGRWYAIIIGVAIEEMTHLSLVSNLTCALGGRPNFDRPNFPVPPGYHPDDVVVRLAPFNMETLNHFIFLERPQGSPVVDSASFSDRSSYRRVAVARRVMPSSQDFLTVGHLYRGIRAGLDHLAQRLGEGELFCGPVDHQVSPAIVSLPGLCVVKDLKSAHAALDTIVDQGEGAPEHRDDSHFARFQAIKAEYEALLAKHADFVPGRAVAENPVMRAPPSDATNRVFIDEPVAALAVDLANALYGQMLRFLVQAFGRSAPSQVDQRLLVDCAVDTMQCLVPVAEALTRLPASRTRPGIAAGMTFAMLRNLSPSIHGRAEWLLMSERMGELARAAVEVAELVPGIDGIGARLNDVAAQLAGRARETKARTSMTETPPELPAEPLGKSEPSTAPAIDATAQGGIETASAPGITIAFEAKRCIHSRFCVLWQPHVYKANVQGPWIDPAADTVEAIVAVAHNCPSGAIRYERHDGGPSEKSPAVNLIYVRENGPLAVRAQIVLNGKLIGYRATLCRCGASNNKPFCDGSHNAAGFSASGEPATANTPALDSRDGPLEILPQLNGPLRVKGNLEICSGTGRTVKRTTGEALCRCGHSQNKPFCDGSHAKIGFRAD